MNALSELRSFLLNEQVQSLLANHPNSLQPDAHDVCWNLLVKAYQSGNSESAIPADLSAFVLQIRRLQLYRCAVALPHELPLPSLQGMSPKKAHEVARMASYIVHLVNENQFPTHSLRIVDIGAGQGYLTRALKHHFPAAYILALDADSEQKHGAQKWEQRLLPKANPPIDHKSILITPNNLVQTIDEWVGEAGGDRRTDELEQPIPVLLVALHACGSLTPDVLRAFIAARSITSKASRWTPAGAVAVGCCYNLMLSQDFPLSSTLLQPTPVHLPISAYHLASQIPSEWTLDDLSGEPTAAVALAMRKVTWRALLMQALQMATTVEPTSESLEWADAIASARAKSATVPARWTRRPETWVERPSEPSIGALSAEEASQEGTGHTAALLRLGKLPSTAYNSWSSFLHAVEMKLSVKFPPHAFDEASKGSESEGEGRLLEGRLEVLHTLRCLLGPVVESAILLDRLAWIKESIADVGDGVNVELVNLFDQATGSGRNVAIVLAPTVPLASSA